MTDSEDSCGHMTEQKMYKIWPAIWLCPWDFRTCPHLLDMSLSPGHVRDISGTFLGHFQLRPLFWNIISLFSQRLYPAFFWTFKSMQASKPIFQTSTLSDLGWTTFLLHLLIKNYFYASSFLFIYDLSASLTSIFYNLFKSVRVAWQNFWITFPPSNSLQWLCDALAIHCCHCQPLICHTATSPSASTSTSTSDTALRLSMLFAVQPSCCQKLCILVHDQG